MYESFFNFTRTPFGRDLPPDQLFPSQDHLEALARLNWAVMQRGMALLTGDVGSGKSTCLRALRAALDPLRSRWLYLSNPLLPARGLYRQLLLGLGVEPRYHKSDTIKQLTDTLRAVFEQGKTPVVVIDDAHLLPETSLQELRLLTNFDMDSACPMALILVGQTPLRDRLRLSCYDQPHHPAAHGAVPHAGTHCPGNQGVHHPSPQNGRPYFPPVYPGGCRGDLPVRPRHPQAH